MGADTVTVEMYRFLLRPRWLAFHAVVLAAIVAMVNLSLWQFDRLAERQAFNDRVIERSESMPVELTELLDDPAFSPEDAEWRPVRARGAYLPDQIVEFNQSQGGRAGDNVLSALLLDDGTTVIVNRGFVPLGFELPAAPTAEVEVIGLVRTSEVRDRGGLTDAAEGPLTEVRRIDIPRIAPQLPGDVAPVYLQLVSSDPPPGVGDPEPAARPELDDGPHLSYAIQWLIFAVCVAIGWVLAVRRSVRQHRAAAPAGAVDGHTRTDRADRSVTGGGPAAPGAAAADSPPADDAAATTAPTGTAAP